MNLGSIAASTGKQSGTVWTLKGSGDLNANLLRFPSGRGVGGHVNDEVDVILVGVAGSGSAVVGEDEHRLSGGDLVFIPRGVWREIRSASDGFAYLSIHRRRGPIRLASREERLGSEAEKSGRG